MHLMTPTLTHVPASTIYAGDNDRRHFDQGALEELAASISAHGLAQPPTVRPVGERFELVAGERRTRAMRDVLGWSSIPVLVRELDDAAAAAVMLAENVSRVDLDPIAEARAYRSRLDRSGGSVAELARSAGVNVDRVRRRLALLSLSDEVSHYVATGQLPLTYAGMMTALDPNRQRLGLEAFHSGRLDVESFRALCGRLLAEQEAEPMFDVSSFMRVEEYVVDAAASVESSATLVDVGEAEPMGIPEVASMLGVKRATVDMWRHRKVMPAPRWNLKAGPLWDRSDIVAWAEATNRLKRDS